MAGQYDVKFLAAAIKANYLTIERAKELFEQYSKAGGVSKYVSIAEFIRQEDALSNSQIDILIRVVGKIDKEEKRPRKQLGPYIVLEKLGEGGMGMVVKGKHSQSGEILAIKILPRRLYDDPEYIERFVREANNASKLNHPNIMRAIGAQKSDDGLYYYAMEYINGDTIQDILDRQKIMSESQTIMTAIQVCQGLQHAHEHGIIHRDVKPENIMVNQQGTVKLTDLGLAKEIVDSNVTQTGIALGTPHYMSPEQARGDRNIDIRSDIYSLGGTIYHMLTGTPPFIGNSAAVVITKHLMEKVPSPKDLRPELSDGICDVISKMMAKDQEDRYSIPTDAIRDLEKVAHGEDLGEKKMDPDKSDIQVQKKAISLVKRRTTPARNRSNKKVSMSVMMGLICLLLLASITLLLDKGTPTGTENRSRRKYVRRTTTRQPISNKRRNLDALNKLLKTVRAFEGKNRKMSGHQNEIIAKWEDFLGKSRETPFENIAIMQLEIAKKNRDVVFTKALIEDEEEKLFNEFEILRKETSQLMKEGQFALALHHYEEFSKKNLNTKIAQKVEEEKEEVYAQVLELMQSSFTELEALLADDRIEESIQKIENLKRAGLQQFQKKIEDFVEQIKRIQSSRGLEAAIQIQNARIRILGAILQDVRSHEYAIALKKVNGEQRKLDEISEDNSKAIQIIQNHVQQLVEIWRQVSAGAEQLVGSTRKLHGVAGKVIQIKNEHIILSSGQMRFEIPLNRLTLKELHSLAFSRQDSGDKEYHLKSAIYWLYHQKIKLAREAISRASQLGADTSHFDPIIMTIKVAEVEDAATTFFKKIQKMIKEKEWNVAALKLKELQKKYSKTLFFSDHETEINSARWDIRRQGGPSLFHGKIQDLGQSNIKLSYDFKNKNQLLDWHIVNHWSHLDDELIVPRSNWIIHTAKFDTISEMEIQVKSRVQFGIGLAFLGWAIELESVPNRLFQLKELKHGLIGRFYSNGEFSSSLWYAGKGDLIQSVSERFQTNQLYHFRIIRTKDSVKWFINGQEFLHSEDLGPSGGNRIALLASESVTRFESVSIQGRLSEDWIEKAIAQSKRRNTAQKALLSALQDKLLFSLFPERPLSLWVGLEDYWKESNQEIRFTGGPGPFPCSLPVQIKSARLKGSFKYPDETNSNGWQLGFRRNGILGYYLDFSPKKANVSLTKMVEQKESKQEPFTQVSIAEKKDIQFVPGIWHQFEVRFDEDQVQVFLDKEFLFLAHDSSFKQGELSLSGLVEAGKATPIHFKDFKLETIK